MKLLIQEFTHNLGLISTQVDWSKLGVLSLGIITFKKGAIMTSNQIAYWTLGETIRANRAKQDEINRSNLVNERENERSHRANESTNLLGVMETQTHNRNTEAETAKHNRNVENETATHNRNTENEDRRSHLANEAAAVVRNTTSGVKDLSQGANNIAALLAGGVAANAISKAAKKSNMSTAQAESIVKQTQPRVTVNPDGTKTYSIDWEKTAKKTKTTEPQLFLFFSNLLQFADVKPNNKLGVTES